MPIPSAGHLPITEALPALGLALQENCNVVLQAPPGAGKSTGVPLALLDAGWLRGKRLVILEPRRVAARAISARMATLLGERVGETVGYRMRMDTRVGPKTRIEVVTEGILARQLQRDAELAGVGLVVFDEFHERNLQADLALALTLDAQKHLRPDLRVLVMSATLDDVAVARVLGGAPVVTAAGRSFSVETHYAARALDQPVAQRCAATVVRALAEQAGDVLAFLPGAGDIRRVAEMLAGERIPDHALVLQLYGELPAEEQDRALAPSPAGRRKVVLATNIAETSLTIEGVGIVIDGGLERRSRFDPANGMSRLETVRISRASADQRRGRAGRLGPGVCYRMWTEAEHRALSAHSPAEITEADLAPLALELAGWGTMDAAELAWLDPPPPATLAQARGLLSSLGALDGAHRITAHGRDMLRVGVHPRIAHMLLGAKATGVAATGCALAALLTERDILRNRDADIRARLEILASGGHPDVDRRALERVRRAADFHARQLGGEARSPLDPDAAGWLLALAYPDRIGRAREAGSGRYQLSNGRGAYFAEPQAMAKSEFVVVATLDAGERDARIYLAAPLTLNALRQRLDSQLVTVERIAWDSREEAVVARREERLGEIVLTETALPAARDEARAAAMLTGVRELGLDALPWTHELRTWQARVLLLRAADAQSSEPWTDVSDDALLASIEQWLAPFIGGATRRQHLAGIDLARALTSLLTRKQQRRLEEWAPTHFTVPSGSRVAIDYLDGDTPSLSVRLQEVFGLTDTPRIAGGRVALVMKLLSPARRPVQVTQDLRSFWERGYHEVRRELKGRYPKHYWPEDPHQAQATRRVRPK